MYFKELVRVGRGLVVLAVALGAVVLINLAAHAGQHAQHASVVQVQIGSQSQVSAAPVRNGNDQIPVSLLFAIAGIVSTFFAGAYAFSLASENSGHLEVAWTKPASRTRYALVTMGVDLLGVAAAFALTLAADVLILGGAKLLSFVYLDQDAGQNLARFLLLPLAFFGLWQAMTASLRNHAGAVVGWSTAACAILLGLGTAHWSSAWHAIFSFLNYFNPLAYGTYSTGTIGHTYPFQAWQLNLTGLAVIGTAGVVAALLQWRKVEA